MESLGTAVLELVADIKPLVAGLEKGKAVSEEMAASTAQGFKGGLTKAAIPAAAAVGALVVGLHKSVDAAEENQVSQAKLAQAFKTAGLNIEDYKEEIDKTEQSSAQLGFKSEDVKAALAQMVVATHDAHSAMNLLSTAQDLARYRGISLTDASKMLTTTMSGSTRAARQLGITFVPVTAATDALKAKTQYASIAAYEHAKSIAYLQDKQASAAKMVSLLNDKLGGQADAFSKTAEGAKQKMGAEFQLLEINIGNALIPALTMISEKLATVSEWMTKHATVVKIVIGVIGTLSVAILAAVAAEKALALATMLAEGTLAPWVAGLALVVIGLVELWKHSQTFRDIVTGAFNDVKSVVTGFVGFFTKSVPNAVDSVVTWVKKHWPEIATVISGPFAPIVAVASNAFGIRSKLIGAFQDIMSWFHTGWKNVSMAIAAPFQTAESAIGKAVNWMIDAVNWVIRGLDKISFKIPSWVPGIGGKGFGIDIPQIPHVALAEGGIVTSPTVALIGEAGPEAVVPLSKAGTTGMGGGITVNVSGVVGNERDVAARIGRELEKLKARGLDFALA